ncbi:hypothetical protein Tco_0933747 [Tanacetum coccineum]
MLSEAQGVSLRITSGVRVRTVYHILYLGGKSLVEREIIVMCKAYGGEPSVDLIRSFLNLGRVGDWLTLSSRGSANVPKALTKPVTHFEDWKGVDGKFHFLPEGGVDENRSSTKSVNNEAPVINAEHIFVVHPSNVAENNMDSHRISSNEGELSPIGHDIPSYLEESKRSTTAGKRKVAVS